MTSYTFSAITVSVDQDGVALLTLNRPKQFNAFNRQMALDLISAFHKFNTDDAVKVVVVTGNGPFFCSGADFREGDFSSSEKTNAQFHNHRDGGGQVALAIHNCTKPTIAAINGAAVGVGITMTLPMSIRYAYKDAKIGFVFSKRGICMEACSSYFLPRLIGHSRALELALTGRLLKAGDKTLDLLFSRVLDNKEDVLKEAMATAREIATQCSVVAGAVSRALIWRNSGDTPEAAHLLDSKGIMWLGNSNDSKEGVTSFLEKRAAVFKDTVSEHMPPNYPWWMAPDVSVRDSKL
ncbi:hypothetical protein CcCBS67573_g05680 [Chytriomyces confervae]|uniref:Enoyl-CoA hydratase n=1 Tax=Chytriomyces confervae TaxID=246404 RepID=A0A507F9V0_9FUNG|nr:hypothetical protein CcCBS67573_g05680 [Chytriomyces confervae]